MENTSLLEEAKRLKAIADQGLLYSTNEYDRDRYQELLEMSHRLMQQLSGHSVSSLKALFAPVKEYPTAKVDVRVLVLSEDKKVLLVKESGDGKWSLPGGWADIGYSPKEVAVKECKEETGLEVVPQRLVAVFDKKMHPHPSHLFYMYKLVLYCKAVTSEIRKGFDVLDVQYFSIDALPEFSADRILPGQVKIAYQIALSPGQDPYCD